MNGVAASNLDAVELESVCSYCHGTGGPEYKGDPYKCPNCEGAGFVPTEFGKKVRALMEHNFRPMLRDAQED